MTEEQYSKVLDFIEHPFYMDFDFWISLLVGCIGLLFSILAYREARKAKLAANEAGKTVKIQTITIELSEIAQRLDKLDFELSFSEARDLLNEVSRRAIRLIAPFQTLDELIEPCTNLKDALKLAKEALDEVRPNDIDEELPDNNIYFATQGHFSNISSLVAEIMGLFEKRSIEVD